MTKKSVILLSGGLDSFVSLDIASKKTDVKLALTFDYGQKAFEDELNAASQIANYYKINHKTIEIPFLKELSDNALMKNSKDKPDNFNSVWIPNRNGLFLNIAACFCDKEKYDCIVFGANQEEAVDFPDNTEEFVKISNSFFKYSTLNNVEVFAPCLKLDKVGIINYAVSNNLPLKYIKSCYDSMQNTHKKHCGKCVSCKLLYNALKKAEQDDLIKELF